MKGRAGFLALGLAILLGGAGLTFTLYHNQTVMIDESYNDQAVSLVRGDRLELTLPGNPSTGYSWSYVEVPDEKVLKPEKQWIGEGSGLVGSPQDYHWEYLAAGAGETCIKLKYSRSWETRPPARAFSVHVKVASRGERLRGLLNLHPPAEN
ncbi:MAG: protease inhibitor I42 family protein [Firmicutes bacterium]|nr:protease inhibitor I42 family protein [Bacillota bacterium]